MGTYHLSARIIKRSSGQSAVASAAYRSGEELEDERNEKSWNYKNKKVAHSEILVPEGAGDWASDRSELWNTIQNKERQWKDGQLARDIEIALPREFTLEENTNLIREYVQKNFVDKGMIADINIHIEKASDGEMNPHAHIMLTMKAIDKSTGELKSAKNRDWNKKALLKEWREDWADSVNGIYEEKGMSQRIDHRTLVEQGIDREPEIHVGLPPEYIQENSGHAQRLERNEAIKERNRIAEFATKAKEAFVQQYRKAMAWVQRDEQKINDNDLKTRDYGFELTEQITKSALKEKDKGFEYGH